VSICRSVIKLFTLSYLHFGQPNSGTDPLRARADRALAGLHGAELLELPVGAAVAWAGRRWEELRQRLSSATTCGISSRPPSSLSLSPQHSGGLLGMARGSRGCAGPAPRVLDRGRTSSHYRFGGTAPFRYCSESFRWYWCSPFSLCIGTGGMDRVSG